MPAQRPGTSGQVFRTPAPFLGATKALLGIDQFAFDFAASAENTCAEYFWDEETNALAHAAPYWASRTSGDFQPGWGWLNPPFKRIGPWAKLCWEMSQLGGQVALLVPAAVGANWWRDFVHAKAHVLFLNGRLHFLPDQPTWGYPKDCALCLYSRQPPWAPTYTVWSWKEPRT